MLHRGQHLAKHIENLGHDGYLPVEMPIDIYSRPHEDEPPQKLAHRKTLMELRGSSGGRSMSMTNPSTHRPLVHSLYKSLQVRRPPSECTLQSHLQVTPRMHCGSPTSCLCFPSIDPYRFYCLFRFSSN